MRRNHFKNIDLHFPYTEKYFKNGNDQLLVCFQIDLDDINQKLQVRNKNGHCIFGLSTCFERGRFSPNSPKIFGEFGSEKFSGKTPENSPISENSENSPHSPDRKCQSFSLSSCGKKLASHPHTHRQAGSANKPPEGTPRNPCSHTAQK